MNFEAIWPKNQFPKKFYRPIVKRIIDQFLFRKYQKKRDEWGSDIFDESISKNFFLGDGGPSKIRLLQSYEDSQNRHLFWALSLTFKFLSYLKILLCLPYRLDSAMLQAKR